MVSLSPLAYTTLLCVAYIRSPKDSDEEKIIKAALRLACLRLQVPLGILVGKVAEEVCALDQGKYGSHQNIERLCLELRRLDLIPTMWPRLGRQPSEPPSA